MTLCEATFLSVYRRLPVHCIRQSSGYESMWIGKYISCKSMDNLIERYIFTQYLYEVIVILQTFL